MHERWAQLAKKSGQRHFGQFAAHLGSAGMELKPGYKQTEVGVIPVDWDLVTADAICDLVVDCKNRTPPVVEGSDFAVVRTPNVRNGKFVYEDLRFTDEESFRIWTARAIPQLGDILITREAPLGEVCLVPPKLRVCLGQRMMLYRVNCVQADSRFVLYALMSSGVQGNLLKKIGGSTVGHAKVEDIRNLQVPLPPTKAEQEAISEALSDADTLIESLEQLLTKKHYLKQAAMQELLSGQQRLPGFYDPWRTQRLSDVANISPGINKPISQMGEGALYVTVQDLYDGTSIRVHTLGRIRLTEQELQAHALMPGDIIFGKSSVKREGIGYPSIFRGAPEPAVCTGFSYRARALPQCANPNFLFHVLRWKPTRRWLIENSQASALTNINKAISDAIPISLPSVEEQVAIATVLSDMDTEITELETKIVKTRALKQGMMQMLLTGEIRLI